MYMSETLPNNMQVAARAIDLPPEIPAMYRDQLNVGSQFHPRAFRFETGQEELSHAMSGLVVSAFNNDPRASGLCGVLGNVFQFGSGPEVPVMMLVGNPNLRPDQFDAISRTAVQTTNQRLEALQSPLRLPEL